MKYEEVERELQYKARNPGGQGQFVSQQNPGTSGQGGPESEEAFDNFRDFESIRKYEEDLVSGNANANYQSFSQNSNKKFDATYQSNDFGSSKYKIMSNLEYKQAIKGDMAQNVENLILERQRDLLCSKLRTCMDSEAQHDSDSVQKNLQMITLQKERDLLKSQLSHLTASSRYSLTGMSNLDTIKLFSKPPATKPPATKRYPFLQPKNSRPETLHCQSRPTKLNHTSPNFNAKTQSQCSTHLPNPKLPKGKSGSGLGDRLG
jgi:hypothetical protein